MTFASRLGTERPTEVAVTDGRESLTWPEADDWLRPTVNALLASDLGDRRRVAVLARNSAHTLLGYVACTLAGTSAVAVNSHLTAPETASADGDVPSAMTAVRRALTAPEGPPGVGVWEDPRS